MHEISELTVCQEQGVVKH